MKILLVITIVLLFSACAKPTAKDKCFGSGGTKYIYNPETNEGQCVYEKPN
jgi:hypothetical protein